MLMSEQEAGTNFDTLVTYHKTWGKSQERLLTFGERDMPSSQRTIIFQNKQMHKQQTVLVQLCSLEWMLGHHYHATMD